MSTLSIAIIASVITGLLSNLPWIIKEAPKLYKDKQNIVNRKKRIIFAVARYILIILCIAGALVFMPLSKSLLSFVIVLVFLCCYFIASDVLYFTLVGAANLSKKDDLMQQRIRLYHQLARCQSNDSDTCNNLIAQINEIDQSIENRTYKSF